MPCTELYGGFFGRIGVSMIFFFKYELESTFIYHSNFNLNYDRKIQSYAAAYYSEENVFLQ